MTTIAILSVILGGLVGLSLGLTGGGGSLLAVPLLVYGLAMPMREAVGVSLLTVGLTGLIGFIQRARQHSVEFPTGILFAVAGMLGAPLGAMLADIIPDQVLMGSFALLMFVIAFRMWVKADDGSASIPILSDDKPGPICRRTPEGQLKITSPCALMLLAIGFAAGILTGLYGVGGGFIIVPALVTFVCMDMKRAVGTSLLIIALVSATGVATHLLAGRNLSMDSAIPFTVGSLLGLFAGSAIAKKVRARTLQRLFAVAIVLVAVYVVSQSITA